VSLGGAVRQKRCPKVVLYQVEFKTQARIDIDSPFLGLVSYPDFQKILLPGQEWSFVIIYLSLT
jgi:hypothetical protein